MCHAQSDERTGERIFAENSRIELGRLRWNNRRNVRIFSHPPSFHFGEFRSILQLSKKWGEGQLHLAATNRCAPGAQEKVGGQGGNNLGSAISSLTYGNPEWL